MTNVISYMIIAIISVAITAYAIYMKRDKYKVSTYIVYYMFATAITWIGEFVFLGLLDAYAYKTGVFEDIWAQNLIGHLLLNTSMFPTAAVVMAAYSFQYIYFIVVIAIFLIIEYIFATLGLYEHHWWTYYMSIINVAAFLLIAKKWFSKMNKERYGLTRGLTFYFVTVLLIHFPSPILLLLGKQHYQLSIVNDIVNNFYRSSIMISFTNDLIISAVCVFLVFKLNKWYWKIVPFIFSFMVISLYIKLNILVKDDGWHLIYYILLIHISIAVSILLEKYTLNNKDL